MLFRVRCVTTREKISGASLEFGRVSSGVEMSHWLVRVYDRMSGFSSGVRMEEACLRPVRGVGV